MVGTHNKRGILVAFGIHNCKDFESFSMTILTDKPSGRFRHEKKDQGSDDTGSNLNQSWGSPSPS